MSPSKRAVDDRVLAQDAEALGRAGTGVVGHESHVVSSLSARAASRDRRLDSGVATRSGMWLPPEMLADASRCSGSAPAQADGAQSRIMPGVQ